MSFSLDPAFVRIFYRTAHGFHVQTVPTLNWNSGGGANGEFETHSSGVIDAGDMVDAFLVAQSKFFLTTTNFYAYEIYTQDGAEAEPVLRVRQAVDVDGTVATAAEDKATQATWTFRTTEGGVFKIVNLDVAINNFEKIVEAGLTSDEQDFIDEVASVDNGWAGRDGGRPQWFLQIAYTLNERLRRTYRQT